VPDKVFEDTVLIAENDSMMRGLLRTVLDRPWRTLLLCANGAEAVALAAQTLVDLVLLDLRMPKMDGIEACALIRALPRYATVPIVILTVFDGETPRRKSLRAGATAFMAKPFSRDQLLRAIDPLMRARKRPVEPERY
jgi:CheY-like chemotaxis protein